MMPYAMPPAETRLSMRTLAGGFFAEAREFPSRLCESLGAKSCVLANSARALLYLLFCHLRRKTGNDKSEILLPGYTCYSVPAAAVKAGLKVALYDMDPYSLEPDLEEVARRINSRTLAVVGQHLFGIRSNISGLTETAHRYGIYCIEDSAQLLTCSLEETLQESSADFTIFSFGRGKPLPLGKGAALTAAEPLELSAISHELEAYPKQPVNFFLPFAVQVFSRPRIYWIPEKLPLGLGHTVFDPSFQISSMPMLYQRMGARGLGELDRLNKHRRLIGNIYHSHFAGHSDSQEKQYRWPSVRYPLLVENGKEVQNFAKYGVRQLYPLALCDLPPLQHRLAERRKQTPGAREIAKRLITLPTHLSVSDFFASWLAKELDKSFLKKAQIRQL